MHNNKKFFIIKKRKFLGSESFHIHGGEMYDLTTAVKKLLALDELKDDADTSYHLQEVNFSMVSDEYINKSEEPLVLKDEVKEDKNWKECIDESLPF